MYKLQVENYQIIKKAIIEFNPGLTLITGKSNNGKTSLIKAFKQAIYNTGGKDYIRHGAKNSSIIINLPDNKQIHYTKGAKDSSYILKDSIGEREFSKLGASQLEEVKNISCIDRDLDFNFWNQLEKPFLLSSSPKEAFDILQTSPYTEMLYDTQQSMLQDKKAEQTSITQIQAQIDLLQMQLKVLEKANSAFIEYENTLTKPIEDIKERQGNLEALNWKVKFVQELEDTCIQLENKLNKYIEIDFIKQIEVLREKYQIKLHLINIKHKLEKNTFYTTLITSNTKKVEVLEKYNFMNLSTLLTASKNNKEKITMIKDKLDSYSFIKNAVNKIETIFEKYSSFDYVTLKEAGNKKLISINSLLLSISKLNQTISPINELLEKEKALEVQIQKIKVFKETNFVMCPLCNTSLHKLHNK